MIRAEMPEYFVSVASRLPNGQQGPGFNLNLTADSYVDALEKAKAQVVQALKDSGLTQTQPVAAPSSPPAPAISSEPA